MMRMVSLKKLMRGAYAVFFLLTLSLIITGCSTPTTPPATVTDKTGPDVAFINPVDDAFVSGSLLFAGTAIDASDIQTVQIRIDSEAWVTLSEPAHYWKYSINTILLAEGPHSATAKATDVKGNSSTEVTVNFTVDQTVPEVSFTYPAHGALLKGSEVITGSATDENGIKSVFINPNQGAQFIDTGDTTAWDYEFLTTAETDGQMIISVIAYDNSGLYAITNIAVIIDNTPPAVTIESPENGVTVSGYIDLTGTASDSQGIDMIMVKIDDSVEQEADGDTEWEFINIDTTLLAPELNPHTLYVIAYDTAGNFTVDYIDIYADQTPPVVSITSPVENSYLKETTNTISGTVTNLTGTDEMQIDLGDGNGFVNVSSFDGTNWSHNIDTTLPGYGGDGQITVSVKATDNTTFAWNTETVKYYIDNTDPAGVISSPADSSSVAQNNSVFVIGTASDAMKLATVRLYIGGMIDQNVTPSQGTLWSYTWNTTGFSGDVEMYIVVTDQAGNEYTSPVTTVTISADVPYGDITSPVQSSIVGGVISLTGNAYDNISISTVKYQFDSTTGTWSDATYTTGPGWSVASYDTAGLTDGLHSLYVKITDNTSLSTIIQVDFYVDNTPPEVEITYPTDANIGTNYLYDLITIAGTASDTNLDSVVVEVDSSGLTVTDLENWTSSWDTVANPGAKEGVVIRATAYDLAGNSSYVEVTVDVKPKISALSADSVLTGQNITISGYNFINNVNTHVRFKSGVSTVDATIFSVVDDNTITVTVPATATSGDIYVVESAVPVESNRVFLHVWEKTDISSSVNGAEQDMAISGTDTYQTYYIGGSPKDLGFSKNGAASTNLDTTDTVGQNPGVAIYGTNVFVSYINFTAGRLKVIRSVNSASSWLTAYQFTFAINKDGTTSIAYDPVNNVVGIAYQSDTNKIMYVYSTDNDSQPGDTWATPVEVDSVAITGAFSQLKYDSAGHPCIAYYNSTTRLLKFASYNGSSWTTTSVSTNELYGQYLSLAIDPSDGVHISFYNGNTGDLMYAYASSVTGSFTLTTVDSFGITGYYTDIAVSGTSAPYQVHIAYVYFSYSQLKYAYFTGSEWEDIPIPTSITTISVTKPSVAVDGTNRYIGYSDGTGVHRLKYKE